MMLLKLTATFLTCNAIFNQSFISQKKKSTSNTTFVGPDTDGDYLPHYDSAITALVTLDIDT